MHELTLSGTKKERRDREAAYVDLLYSCDYIHMWSERSGSPNTFYLSHEFVMDRVVRVLDHEANYPDVLYLFEALASSEFEKVTGISTEELISCIESEDDGLDGTLDRYWDELTRFVRLSIQDTEVWDSIALFEKLDAESTFCGLCGIYLLTKDVGELQEVICEQMAHYMEIWSTSYKITFFKMFSYDELREDCSEVYRLPIADVLDRLGAIEGNKEDWTLTYHNPIRGGGFSCTT